MSFDSLSVQQPRKYDLEERTFTFANNVQHLAKQMTLCGVHGSYIDQLIRSSGSVGANYIEANESLGKKDLALHIRISRKEAKETIYWLNLLDCTGHEDGRDRLINECTQLMRIFGAILEKFK